MNQNILGTLPDNISVFPYVDQLDILSKADVFITHCGMNSVSESLYMAAPMILYPQTGEQCAVARRVTEIGAGVLLRDDSFEGIRIAVQEILNNASYAKAAAEYCFDFRACSGAVGAAEFIENAPHTSNGMDITGELNKENAKFQLLYWLIVIAAAALFGLVISWKVVWIIGIASGVLAFPIGRVIQKRRYKRVIDNQHH